MNIDILTTGLAFPEGPVVLANGDLLVVEVLGGRLTRIAADGAARTVAELGGGPNGAAIGPDGQCYVCNNGGFAPSASPDLLIPTEAPFDTPPGSIQVVDLASGAWETLYASSEAAPFWAPNDLVFDDAGGFWFSDHGRDRGRMRQKGGVYYAMADGSAIREVIFPIDSANGVGLSPDGATLYVADTLSGQLWRFPLSAPGVVSDAGSIVGRVGPGQFLDSLAVEQSGRICVASPGQGAILIFSPDGGIADVVPMPDFLTTNICFGGADFRKAYVTLGSSGRVASMDWPRPGLPLACAVRSPAAADMQRSSAARSDPHDLLPTRAEADR
jgi:gluconolactonase